jgi:2-polyprenyl-6-methoxyphenol hydroxylase-like FAD-dependent oxidoreductase
MSDPNVVIVGGGPIGLWTAIQTKSLNPNKEIVVLEKHQQYQRADIRLQLDKGSFSGAACKPLKDLTKEWGNKVVPIQEMENKLADLAGKLGIKILKGKSVDPEKLLTEYPNTEIFIGADGAHSSMRKKFFNDEYRFNTPLQHIAQIQYKMKKAPTKNGKWFQVASATEDYVSQLFAGHFVSKTVTPLKDGTFQVSLRVFIDEKTYSEINKAKFNSPYYFTTSLQKVPDKLKNILIHWWGAHPKQTVLADESNKITAIALTSYAAKEFVKEVPRDPGHPGQKGHAIVALVGDAAQAYPFFRAINNGLLTATSLANTIAKAKEPNVASFKSYTRYAAFRAVVERIRAACKNFFLNVVKIWFFLFKNSGMKSGSLRSIGMNESHKRGKETWDQLAKASA